MQYGQLFKAVDWFKNDAYVYDSAYIQAQKLADWKNLHTFSDDRIKKIIPHFLNQWRCRIRGNA